MSAVHFRLDRASEIRTCVLIAFCSEEALKTLGTNQRSRNLDRTISHLTFAAPGK